MLQEYRGGGGVGARSIQGGGCVLRACREGGCVLQACREAGGLLGACTAEECCKGTEYDAEFQTANGEGFEAKAGRPNTEFVRLTVAGKVGCEAVFEGKSGEGK